MDYSLILSVKFATAEWRMNSNDYETLDWLDNSPKPTEAELQALWPTVQYEVAYAKVEQARAQAYRETADPLFFQYQRGEVTEQEWLDAVEAVKVAHPYPEAP